MYTVITISTTFLLSFALGIWAIPNIIKVSLKKSLFDMPDSIGGNGFLSYYLDNSLFYHGL